MQLIYSIKRYTFGRDLDLASEKEEIKDNNMINWY